MDKLNLSPQTNDRLALARLGENVRRTRRCLEVSQEALADMCGLHRTYVSDVERGSRNVSFASLLKLARGLGTTIAELTRNVEDDPRPQSEPSNGQ
jgi:transcriptional regulator with XRE-family HTH domain